MKQSTYQVLYQAHFGHFDKDALKDAFDGETDPFLRQVLLVILGEKGFFSNDWDVDPFTKDFRSVPAGERLQETIVTFLSRLAVLVKEQTVRRMLSKPESFAAAHAWLELLKRAIYAILSLGYDVEWKPKHFLKLSDVVLDILQNGNARGIRDMMTALGITMVRDEYEAEKRFGELFGLHIMQHGPSDWRLLHWMAEAVKMVRKDSEAKTVWRHLVVDSFHRTLGCPFCSQHFEWSTKQLRSELLDEKHDFAKMLFDIHNRVHAQRRELQRILEPDYTWSEYEEDAKYMRKALEK
jgi:hypothetical protein